jgi:hypothetical protein
MAATTPSARSGSRARRWAIGAAVAVALVVAVALGLALTGSDPPRRGALPTPPVPTVPTPTPTPTPVVGGKPALAHEYVPAAAPHSFTLGGKAFTIKARVCGMPYVRPLDPPGEQHRTVCWVRKGFGVAPGSNSGTTYVLGHAWARDPNEVLNPASTRATREVLAGRPRVTDGVSIYPVRSLLGYQLTLQTATGKLTYTVRTAYGVRKAQAGNYSPLMNERTRNRVVLITCAERHGVDYDYNIILEAYLTSSQRTGSRA